MRAWRALKVSGAIALRDGVYLMPEQGQYRTALEGITSDVRTGGGTARVMRTEEPEDAAFTAPFGRSDNTLGAKTAKVSRTTGRPKCDARRSEDSSRVTVSMVQVRQMCVAMREGLMPMRMGMRLRAIVRAVRMLVVLVVHMAMRMHHGDVHMGVVMPL